MVSAFPKDEQKRKTTFDYVLRVLVYEHFSVIKEIIHKQVANSDVRAQLTLWLRAIRDFLQ